MKTTGTQTMGIRFADGSEPPRNSWRATLTRGAGIRGVAWVLLCLAGMLGGPGCDSASFMPPPHPELTGSAGLKPFPSQGTATSPALAPSASPAIAPRQDASRRPGSGVKIVELLLARNPDANRIYFEQVLRREMGKARIAFRLGPQGVDTSGKNPRSFSPTELAQAIRKAVEYGVSGLIVEPVEEPAVLDALAEAGRRGVSLLALDRAVTLPGGPAIPVVRYESFERPGRQIIEATLDAAKLLGEPGRGRIVLLHHRSADPSRNERRESLAGPLRAAGKPFEVIEFEGDHTVAVAALQNAMATPPRIAIVLADDEQGMTACSQILVQLRQSNRPEFLFAGFIPYDYRSAGEMLNQGIAFGDPSVESFATQTFQTLRRLLEGKTVDKPVEIPITIHKKSTLFVPTKPSAED